MRDFKKGLKGLKVPPKTSSILRIKNDDKFSLAPILSNLFSLKRYTKKGAGN